MEDQSSKSDGRQNAQVEPYAGKTQYLDTGGGRLAFDLAGSGPLVLCAPGMGDLRQEYRYLVPRLVAAGFRIATMDVRGHGSTSVKWDDYSVAGVGADLIALIRHLGGPAAIIGTSMAAGAAVYAAAEAQDLVSGLVLIGPFVRDVPGPRWFGLLLQVLFRGPWGVPLWMIYYSSLYPTRKPNDFAAYKARLRSNLRKPGRLAALRAMLAASKSASEARLNRVSVPVLVIMGSRDRDFKDPEAEARLVSDRLHARLQMVEGAGHYPHVEMPEQIGPVIIDFLRELAIPTGQGTTATG